MTSNRPVQAGNIVAASMRAWAQKAQRVVWPALALALAIGWPASGGAFQLLPDDPSPKSGTAQVAAQGVIDVGGGDLRWQVTSRTASPPANAAPQMSQPGFLIVDEGVMLVEDLSSGAQHRLPAGEAVLTTPGSEQLRVALGSDAAAYLDIALVDAATLPEDASGLLFTSEGFPGLGARHDMDLLADTLPAGVPMTVPGGALPTLVLVRAGSADVTTDAGDIISLADDEAVALSGAVVVTGTGEGAEVVAVVTGPAVPRLSAPSGATPAAPARAIEAPSGDATAAPQVAVAATPEAETEAAAADRDSDGLTDAEEAELNTDPALADTLRRRSTRP